MRKRPLFDRFMDQAFPEPMSGCWIWTGQIMWSGYPLIKNENRRTTRAHRVAHELFKGPIPKGLTIDHLCRNRACVNPNHLEAVSIHANTMRSQISLSTINAKKTHCVHGHLLDKVNKQGSRIHRSCRICNNARSLKHYYSKKERSRDI